MTSANESAGVSVNGSGESEGPGGASPSSDGFSGPLGIDDATEELTPVAGSCPECAQVFQTRAGLLSHLRAKHPGAEVPAGPASPREPAEQRPAADGAKRSRWAFGKARTRRESPGIPPTRPRARRVSTARLGSTLTTFAAGGVGRLGQEPLAMIMGFTSPVAGEIMDDAIAGTVVDRVVQPFVRGQGKYEDLGALVACWVSVAWASNNPENAEPAYAMFSWSMQVLLPKMGKEMAARASEQRKAAEQLAEVMPELQELFGPGDPIRNLWAGMWAKAAPPEAAPAEEPAPV